MARYKIFRKFPSFKIYHYQKGAKGKTLLVKISLTCMRTKIHFHIKSFARSLALKQWIGTTRQWSVCFGLRDVQTFPCFSLVLNLVQSQNWCRGIKRFSFVFSETKCSFEEKKELYGLLIIYSGLIWSVDERCRVGDFGWFLLGFAHNSFDDFLGKLKM